MFRAFGIISTPVKVKRKDIEFAWQSAPLNKEVLLLQIDAIAVVVVSNLQAGFTWDGFEISKFEVSQIFVFSGGNINR